MNFVTNAQILPANGKIVCRKIVDVKAGSDERIIEQDKQLISAGKKISRQFFSCRIRQKKKT